jgi:hypothetical protein
MNKGNHSPPKHEAPRGRFYDLGCRISEWVSNLAAQPFVQIGFVIFCLAWFALGLSTNLLTAALSIIAITLTQMVLNRQNEREAEARRRMPDQKRPAARPRWRTDISVTCVRTKAMH